MLHPRCSLVRLGLLLPSMLLLTVILLLLIPVQPASAEKLVMSDEQVELAQLIYPLISSDTKLVANDGASGDNFGWTVDIDGDTAIVGAWGDDLSTGGNAGAAYIFVRNGTTWTQQAKLVASDAAPGDNFGGSVAIDGDTAIVGADTDSTAGNRAGSAYIFVRSGTMWSQQAELFASDATSSHSFGWDVDIDEDIAVVSTPADDTAGTDAGSAYVFVRSGTMWSQQAELTTVDTVPGGRLGWSVAINRDSIIVGAVGNFNESISDAGSAYVFVRSGTTWNQQGKLTPSDATGVDRFGVSVDISADTAIVGAYTHDSVAGPNSNSGAAYIFVRSDIAWTQQAKLTASDATASDFLGISVAIDEDTAIAGAFGDRTTGGGLGGSAYTFVRSGTAWSEQSKLVASDHTGGNWFGSSVTIDEATALVGASGYDNGAAGAVYLYEVPNDWQPAGSLPTPRALHAAAVVGSDAYVIGGQSPNGAGGILPLVEHAHIQADGTLGPWHAVASLNIPRFRFPVVAHDGYLYAIGGNTGHSHLAEIERAEVKSDGTLEPWQIVALLPSAQYGQAATVVGNSLYVVGGLYTKQVIRSEFQPDGTLGPWETMPELTEEREALATVQLGNHLYAIGGHYGFNMKSSVERALIHSDGTLGAWQPINAMTTARDGLVAFVDAEYIYALGGTPDNADGQASLERLYIAADGSYSSWEIVNSMNAPRAYFAAFTGSGYVYASGGNSIHGQDYLSSVERLKMQGNQLPSPLEITTSSPLSNGTAGQPYALNLTATGGTAPYTWAVVDGTLPLGLDLGFHTAALAGTPTAAANWQFTVLVVDAENRTVTKVFNLTVQPAAPPTGLSIVTDSALSGGTVGTFYSVVLEATGGIEPYTWSVIGTLPPGLELAESTGEIRGVPTTAGTFSFTIQVTDSSGSTVEKPFAITPPPPSGSPGLPYTGPIVVALPTDPVTPSSGCTNYAVVSGTLPDGLTLDQSTGLITGTPTVPGTYNFVVQCTTGNNQIATKAFSITITGNNQPPTAIPGDGYSVPEGGTRGLTGEGTDADGDALSFVWDLNNDGIFETPGQSPTFSAVGRDGPSNQPVVLRVCDSHNACASSSTTIEIKNVPPTTNAGADQSVFRNDLVSVTGTWSDPAAALDNLYTWSWDLNGDGTADESNTASYGDTIVRATSFAVSGTAILTFTVTDKDGAMNSDAVQVTVINRTPQADAQDVQTAEDTPLTITLTGTDPDQDTLTFIVVDLPSHGELAGDVPNLTYTPKPHFFGTDSFTFKVNDGLTDSNVAPINIMVNSVNNPPMALDDAEATAEDTPVTIVVQTNDSAGPSNEDPALTTTAVTDPAHGTAVINGDGSVTYTPDLNFSGTDSFGYTVCDSEGTCDDATVTVPVDQINDPPVANDDNVTTLEDTLVPINVLANDSDADGNLNAASVTLLTTPANGSLTDSSNGVFTYTPAPNFNGVDSFSYQVCDTDHICDDATVNLTVDAVNDHPVCGNAVPSVAILWPPNHQFEAVTISGITDEEGDAITVAVTTIFQDEPTNDNGDGNSTPDGQGIGTATAQVRAERQGNGNGRYYHISFSAGDGNGGACAGTVKVSVPKSMGNKGAAVDDGSLYDSTLP